MVCPSFVSTQHNLLYRCQYDRYALHTTLLFLSETSHIHIQAMIKTLFEHFEVLYEQLLPRNPSLAAEHTLKQEEEVYKASTKTTYRNVCQYILSHIQLSSSSSGNLKLSRVSEETTTTGFDVTPVSRNSGTDCQA